MGPIPPGRTLAGAFITAIALAAPAAAQQPPAGGAEARFAAGLVAQHGVFGDDGPKTTANTGLVLAAQVRRRTTGLTGVSFEAVLQPIGLRNPHFDETLRTAYLLIGAEIGRETYVRPTGGVALQAWSGTRAETGLNLALAAGVAVGRRFRARGVWINPEFVVRCSASPGAASAILGAQVAVGPRR